MYPGRALAVSSLPRSRRLLPQHGCSRRSGTGARTSSALRPRRWDAPTAPQLPSAPWPANPRTRAAPPSGAEVRCRGARRRRAVQVGTQRGTGLCLGSASEQRERGGAGAIRRTAASSWCHSGAGLSQTWHARALLRGQAEPAGPPPPGLRRSAAAASPAGGSTASCRYRSAAQRIRCGRAAPC